MWNEIATAARSHGSAPMYTWVNPVGRIELSGTTFLNGVSKAANMMRDGLEIDSGEEVFIDLGNHWQSPIWFSAALSLQAAVSSRSDGVLAIVNRESLQGVTTSRETVVISRDPFGMPEKDLDPTVVNGSLEVRGFGDVFSPLGAFSQDEIVFKSIQQSLSLSEVRSTAGMLMAEHEVAVGSRIAVTGNFDLIDRAMWQVVVPVLARCSVVLLDGVAESSSTCEVERVDRLITID